MTYYFFLDILFCRFKLTYIRKKIIASVVTNFSFLIVADELLRKGFRLIDMTASSF